MDNLKIYDKYSTVPDEAQKPIKAGRLKGYTDINPMWRIKCLTEEFGACGTGWRYNIISSDIVDVANEEKLVLVTIELFYKITKGEWSVPIYGTGGAKLVAKESKGLYVDDDATKKAITDALSVACKALGIGANIYWSEGSKYTGAGNVEMTQKDKLAKDLLKLCEKAENKMAPAKIKETLGKKSSDMDVSELQAAITKFKDILKEK